ncbi:MAG: hypothetical protein QMD92_00265 [bacterium]|nr:hypothetical protein [bacterium]
MIKMVELTCKSCYAYLEIGGSVPRSVFSEDSDLIDMPLLQWCPVCGESLKGEKSEFRKK